MSSNESIQTVDFDTLNKVFQKLESCNQIIAEIESHGYFMPEYSLEMIAYSFDSMLGNRTSSDKLTPDQAALAYMTAAENQAAIYLINEVLVVDIDETDQILTNAKYSNETFIELKERCIKISRSLNQLNNQTSSDENNFENLKFFVDYIELLEEYSQTTLALLEEARLAYNLSVKLHPERERFRSYEIRDEPKNIIKPVPKFIKISSIVAVVIFFGRLIIQFFAL